MKNLIKGMLRYNPANRLTWTQIVQNPAIREQKALETSLMLYNLKKVNLENKDFDKI